MKRFVYAVSAITVITAAVLMMLVAVVPAFAQTKNPCEGDFAKYCSDTTRGSSSMVKCYEQNKGSMSRACISWAEGVKAHGAEVRAACAKEIDERCNYEKGEPFALLDCLEGHYVSSSEDCRVKLNQFKYYYPKKVQ